ncbi:hypothetical protein RhiJN_08749 [Ceratobasidium sp. AG-Ba]|nr:hypothetical protein RhiJN_08749 [Ceratobasidium sp. AG-Ba]
MSVSKADLPFDFDDVYGEDCPIREENFKLDNESAKDKPQAGMGQGARFPYLRRCTAEFWEGVEVYGFMLMPGTNGDGRCHELALFLNTAGNYSYALMEPEDTIRERWLHVLASWSKAQVTKKNRKPEPIPLPQPPLQFGIPPTWWLKKNGNPATRQSGSDLSKRATETTIWDKSSSVNAAAVGGSSSNESLSEPHGNSEAEEETAQAPEASVISVPVSLAVPQRTSRPQRKPKPAYVEIDPPAPTPVVTQAGAEGSSSAKPSLGTDARPEPAPKRQKVMRIEHLAPPKLSSGSIALEGQEAKARMQAEADSGPPVFTECAERVSYACRASQQNDRGASHTHSAGHALF